MSVKLAARMSTDTAAPTATVCGVGDTNTVNGAFVFAAEILSVPAVVCTGTALASASVASVGTGEPGNPNGVDAPCEPTGVKHTSNKVVPFGSETPFAFGSLHETASRPFQL